MGDVIKIFAIANGNSISNNFKKFYNIYDKEISEKILKKVG